jgi:hypothetical protein
MRGYCCCQGEYDLNSPTCYNECRYSDVCERLTFETYVPLSVLEVSLWLHNVLGLDGLGFAKRAVLREGAVGAWIRRTRK